MRLVLDVQALQSDAHATRGIGRYAAEYVGALLDAGAPVDMLACNPMLPAPEPALLPAEIAGSGLLQWNTPERFRAIAGRGPIVYHILSPFETEGPPDGVVPLHALRGAAVLAVTLYDVIPYRFPERYQATPARRRFFQGRAALVRAADLVLAISRYTATDAVATLGVDPHRVVVAGTGGSEYFTPAGAGDDPARVLAADLPEIRKPFVLSVSGFEPRKDPETLIRAFASLRPDVRAAHQLVIACELPPGAREHWGATVAAAGLAPGEVVLTGHVTDETLRALHRRARVFAFTSRAEGFGLPVLEAARCGCPAVTSDAFALPEVLEEPASTFPAGDARALASLLDRALGDDGFRAALIRASARAATTHTWPIVAGRATGAYEAATARRAAARRHLPQPRPRIALAGPFPPSPSGVAAYNARVAAALAALADVDCFVEGTTPPAAPAGAPGLRRFPIRALGRMFSPWSYDAVVYTIGNSEYHRETLRAALSHPGGVVWLHEAFLAGLYLTAAGLYVDGAPPPDLDAARRHMRDARQRCAGPGAPDLGRRWAEPEAYAAAGLTMTEEVLGAAGAVIVTTQRARELVAAATPADVPATVMPLAISGADPLAGVTNATREDLPLVVSPGWIDPIKRPDDMVRVLAAVRRSIPAHLALVGRATDDQRHALLALAAELGCADALTITGFVDEVTYRSWIARASCVVLLRRNWRGEGSGAIADALARGRPVVTNIGAARELPPGVVELLDDDAPVAEIADTVLAVLTSPERRAGLVQRAERYASSWGFAEVARALLGVAGAMPRPRFPVRPGATVVRVAGAPARSRAAGSR